ncbi:OprO/OprP family phosphate-selective porin [Geoalkalibacter halelectricus]|uniref:OprO/OprP family phosphate-selective porin n=1 Tax=Geoalkalibacter halelectricus TaxID=2847045 RepID=A0ABY5ZMA1_9BACT|nr:OprO/OprP family phosphate-selective porin [Geoalkalibacter halelectricus]MDO3378489.1 OprO/OprP family phosphate-selective porin [Geoalkalibacter halelectricus]UWZ80193.1 OprO/OprP family phosphate-selective porin [Geoalkalibacter halelectricus]
MKKTLVAALVAATTLSFGLPAEAKTLEEILRDKGIISAEDYQAAVKKNDLAYYRPGRGITVESRDGNYTAHIGGRLQVRYTYTDVDDSAKEDTSNFNIQRMRVSMRGNVYNPNLYYQWQHDFGGGGGATLKDAVLGYKFMDELSVQAGQFKAPTSRQQLTSSGSQMFVDRSLADGFFNLGRDRGIMARGAFADNLVEYMAGVFNGNGENRSNPENNHLWALRVDVNPLGRFAMDEPSFNEPRPLLNLGASIATTTVTTADQGNGNNNSGLLRNAVGLNNLVIGPNEDVDVWTATLNAHFKWMGLSAAAEYYFANIDPDGHSDWDADGYYLQAGYQIIPETLELALRYSAVDSTDSSAPTAVRFDQNQFQIAAGYYYKKHRAKIQADYTIHKDDLRDNRDDNIFRVQAQVIF